jgi:hypothetical protein
MRCERRSWWRREARFEPVLVPKRAGRISGGLDDMVISLYAHGMTPLIPRRELPPTARQ